MFNFLGWFKWSWRCSRGVLSETGDEFYNILLLCREHNFSAFAGTTVLLLLFVICHVDEWYFAVKFIIKWRRDFNVRFVESTRINNGSNEEWIGNEHSFAVLGNHGTRFVEKQVVFMHSAIDHILSEVLCGPANKRRLGNIKYDVLKYIGRRGSCPRGKHACDEEVESAICTKDGSARIATAFNKEFELSLVGSVMELFGGIALIPQLWSEERGCDFGCVEIGIDPYDGCCQTIDALCVVGDGGNSKEVVRQ